MRFWSIQLETKDKCPEIENIQVVLIKYIQLKYTQFDLIELRSSIRKMQLFVINTLCVYF